MSPSICEAKNSSSSKEEQVIATIRYQIDEGVRDTSEDAWNRGYTTAPKVTQIPVAYPLHDFRKIVFGSDVEVEGLRHVGWSWSRSAELLKKFGFTAVKFDPKWAAKADDEVQAGDYDDLQTLENTYFPEVTEAVLRLTGARHVFITNSIVRRGDAPIKKSNSGPGWTSLPDHNEVSADSNATGTVAADGKGRDRVPDDYKALEDTRPTHLASSDNSRPARGAHVDYTSLGARRSIRRWRPDIYRAAAEAGIIDAEDNICGAAQVDPQNKESNAIIDEKYNADGKLGPRYAAYSVWRPMRTVTRDPLAMAPRWTFPKGDVLGFLGYESRMLAAPAMGGDFLRELEAVSVSKDVAKAYESSNGADAASQLESPQWYYLPEQKPDEVIVLKFFDSAALGGGVVSGEAGGAPHASPDLGKAAYGRPRWSIEVRCIVIW